MQNVLLGKNPFILKNKKLSQREIHDATQSVFELVSRSSIKDVRSHPRSAASKEPTLPALSNLIEQLFHKQDREI